MPGAIVVGAGLGGLGTAIRLRHAGWDVTVLERNERIGGRCNVLRQDGFTFDTGPTLLLMRDVLDELFASVGRRLDAYLDLCRVHPNYRIRFGDGSLLEVSSDLDAMDTQLEAIEPGAAAAFRRYMADAGYKYRVSRDRFVSRNFPRWHDFVTLPNLYYLFATNTLRPLDRHAARYFRDSRLIAAFTFQTMYLGLPPHDAPAVYSLLPYTEIAEGIWFPRGGMYRLVEALGDLAVEMGVNVETDTSVRAVTVDRGMARGVELVDGTRRAADVVVSNADLPYTYRELLPAELGGLTRRRLPRLNPGSSAFLLYLGVDREFPELLHHNVFLSRDVRSNFDAIFRERRLPDDPSFYVCAASRTDRSLAPEGCEGIYVLVPVPSSTQHIAWEQEEEPFAERVLDRLVEVGLDVRKHIVFEQRYTPDDFTAEYNLTGGSAFGISHCFTQVGYMRPSNKASGVANMYFVGASTVPGGGVPMVLLGSRLTAERVLKDAARA